MQRIKEDVRKLVKECVYVGELSSEKISDKILSLIQSHLVKEIENLRKDEDWILMGLDYGCAKQDIIEIINNIC